MLSGFRGLALEAWFLDRARSFYRDHLDLRVVSSDDRSVTFDAGGGQRLALRAPGPVPRGGVHVHYAFATPHDRYAEWRDRLDDSFDLDEHDFGGARSLYFYDPDDHCVEIGQRDDADGDAPLAGIFEVVLEVERLDRAEAFYRELGFEVTNRGDGRERVRLGGPVDLELWEPQRGIADARGGVHVDLGFVAPDPEAAADAVADRACSRESVDGGGVRIRDPDGHYLAFERPD